MPPRPRASRSLVADLTGFEPATSALTGRRALRAAPQVLAFYQGLRPSGMPCRVQPLERMTGLSKPIQTVVQASFCARRRKSASGLLTSSSCSTARGARYQVTFPGQKAFHDLWDGLRMAREAHQHRRRVAMHGTSARGRRTGPVRHDPRSAGFARMEVHRVSAVPAAMSLTAIDRAPCRRWHHSKSGRPSRLEPPIRAAGGMSWWNRTRRAEAVLRVSWTVATSCRDGARTVELARQPSYHHPSD